MKKVMFYAAFAMLMLCVMCSCKKKATDQKDAIYKENIIGKWRSSSYDGIDELTNMRTIRSFNADGSSQSSLTRYGEWNAKSDEIYNIENCVIVVSKAGSSDVTMHTIKDITSNSMIISKFVFTNRPEFNNSKEEIYDKINVDYSSNIIGVWEGVSLDGDTTYGSQDHRWEFYSEKDYTYYVRDEGVWVTSANTFNEYNVDGNWLAFRWIQYAGGDMNYEWWDIEQCDENQMVWTALRERADGTRFTTKFTMRKVTGDE